MTGSSDAAQDLPISLYLSHRAVHWYGLRAAAVRHPTVHFRRRNHAGPGSMLGPMPRSMLGPPRQHACSAIMTTAAVATPEELIRWRYLAYALAALAVMIAAIVLDNFWLLNFIHVSTSLLWTGVDLYMGFVL